jgi:hypothetical protein
MAFVTWKKPNGFPGSGGVDMITGVSKEFSWKMHAVQPSTTAKRAVLLLNVITFFNSQKAVL